MSDGYRTLRSQMGPGDFADMWNVSEFDHGDFDPDEGEDE